MRTRLSLLLVLFLVAIFSFHWMSIQSRPTRDFVLKGPGKRDDWFMNQRRRDRVQVSLDAFKRATQQAERIRSKTNLTFDSIARWEFVGPTNVGGRVVDLSVDPTQKDSVFIASATGGVWRSVDAGASFESTWPNNFSQSIGAIASDPKGTLYVGTGEANPGGGSLVFGGAGVFRSEDKGKTWQHLGLEDSQAIGRVVVCPSKPEVVYVAATGPLFNEGGERGLYRSTNRGQSWELILAGENPTTGAVDVAVDPSNPDRIFVAMWDRIRTPNQRRYGGPGSGLFRSEDGGKTWELLTNGLPADRQNLGRIGIGLAPNDSKRVYAIYIAAKGNFRGIYTSDDYGNSWQELAVDSIVKNSQSSFGWWFGRLWVDPKDKDHLFVAGVPLLESKDGGKSFTRVLGKFHVDQHALAWDPHKENRVYLGNDGGVYRSEENGSVLGKWEASSYQPFTQFYTLAVSADSAKRISGGTQDNGSVRSWSSPPWDRHWGGDGLMNLISYRDKNIIYACSQYGNCGKSTDGGETMSGMVRPKSDRRNWLTPLVFDHNDPSIMYYGGNILNRSTDGGDTWQPISPSLSEGLSEDAYPFGTITTIEISKSHPKTLFAGTDDGRLWKTVDLGGHWKEIKSETLPKHWITRIVISPDDVNEVFVTYSGFRAGINTAHVLHSLDGGKTWNDISGNLPEAPVNDFILRLGKPTRFYVATDVGVFFSDNGGKEWFSQGQGLPLVSVMDMEYHESTQYLYVGTFGRGVYRIPG